MQDTSSTWWFSELNKKMFFASYKKKLRYPEWIKAYKEGLAWLVKSEWKGPMISLPDLSYNKQENLNLAKSFSINTGELLSFDETINEVVWQQRYFFEKSSTKGCLMKHHPALCKSRRIPDAERTYRLVLSLFYYLTSAKA